MKYPLSRIETTLLVINILIVLSLFFLPLTRTCWERYCPPGTPKVRFQFQDALLLSVFSSSFIIFAISLNKVRKQVAVFGGWGKLFRNLLLTIVITGFFTGLPILIFWNKPLVFSGPILGPIFGSLISSYLFYKQKLALFFIFSISVYIPVFLMVWVLIYLLNTILR